MGNAYPPNVLPDEMRTWTDSDGVVWPTPTSRGRLKCQKIRSHATLRAFVFKRDKFTCQECRRSPKRQPNKYDGRRDVRGITFLVIDHIVSRLNGGSHHPSNLRACCDSCNASKAGKVDAKHPNAVLREKKRLARLRRP